MPIDRAVPSTVLMAASTEAALRSGIFFLAISSTCALVRLPTLVLLGTAEPLAIPTAFMIKMGTGGVGVMKVKERSAYTVMTTGVIVPSSAWVFALKALQNSMMLTPC